MIGCMQHVLVKALGVMLINQYMQPYLLVRAPDPPPIGGASDSEPHSPDDQGLGWHEKFLNTGGESGFAAIKKFKKYISKIGRQNRARQEKNGVLNKCRAGKFDKQFDDRSHLKDGNGQIVVFNLYGKRVRMPVDGQDNFFKGFMIVRNKICRNRYYLLENESGGVQMDDLIVRVREEVFRKMVTTDFLFDASIGTIPTRVSSPTPGLVINELAKNIHFEQNQKWVIPISSLEKNEYRPVDKKVLVMKFFCPGTTILEFIYLEDEEGYRTLREYDANEIWLCSDDEAYVNYEKRFLTQRGFKVDSFITDELNVLYNPAETNPNVVRMVFNDDTIRNPIVTEPEPHATYPNGLVSLINVDHRGGLIDYIYENPPSYSSVVSLSRPFVTNKLLSSGVIDKAMARGGSGHPPIPPTQPQTFHKRAVSRLKGFLSRRMATNMGDPSSSGYVDEPVYGDLEDSMTSLSMEEAARDVNAERG